MLMKQYIIIQFGKEYHEVLGATTCEERIEELADMLEVSANPNIIVKVSKNPQGQARVTVHDKSKGSTSTRYLGNHWAKQFLKALEDARSERYKKFFKKVVEEHQPNLLIPAGGFGERFYHVNVRHLSTYLLIP